MKTWVFRADAGTGIGLGHLRRVSVLAQTFEGRRVLILRSDSEALAQESRAAFDEVVWLPFTASLSDEIASYPSGQSEGVILDLSHYETIKRPDYVNDLLDHWRSLGKIALIDGYTHDSLRRVVQLRCDFVLTPYIGLPDETGDFIHLNGSEYFILDPRYRYQGYQCRTQIEGVLISMGGADPAKLTVQFLQKLNKDGYGLKWTVVVGPSFHTDNIAQLKSFEATHPWVKLNFCPKDLSHLYQSHDYAFVGDGLTKYELASLGVPMALMSSTEAGEEANGAFASRTGCENFGRIESLTTQLIANFFNSARIKLEQRQNQSQQGRRLVDGDGAQRIARRLQ